MSGKNVLSAALPLLAATLQSGCMTSNPGESCTVEGAQFLSESATETQICNLFEAKLSEAMEDEGAGSNLAMSIEIEKTGTINASIAKMTGSDPATYPTISVDVMDRPLNLSDVERLAVSAAEAIQSEDARKAASTE